MYVSSKSLMQCFEQDRVIRENVLVQEVVDDCDDIETLRRFQAEQAQERKEKRARIARALSFCEQRRVGVALGDG